MNKLHTYGLLAAFGFAGAAFAQDQETPPQPRPSTSQTEGTAADRTPPGETPTRETPPEGQMDPRPSTSPAEGTAADRTMPGETPTAASRSQGTELVGTAVVTPADAPLGKVVDVVFDTKGQPDFVVISVEGEATAVPYATASSMMSGDKVVMEESRLQAAPKVQPGEWRSRASNWKSDSERYWERERG